MILSTATPLTEDGLAPDPGALPHGRVRARGGSGLEGVVGAVGAGTCAVAPVAVLVNRSIAVVSVGGQTRLVFRIVPSTSGFSAQICPR